MSKVRIYEVAKELGMEQKALVTLVQSMGFADVRNHMSSVEPELVERVRRHIEKQKSSSIVEERIRPTVVKRRAVGRPDKSEAPPPPEAPASLQVPVSRPSVRSAAPSMPAPEPVSVASEAPPPSPREPAGESAPPMEPVAAAPSVPEARPSSPRPPPARKSVPAVELQRPTDDVGAPAVFSPPEPVPSVPPREPAPPSAAPEPPVVPAAAATPEPPPPPAAEPAAPPARSPRPSSPPRTGIETWAGRPGVPMPVPAQRSAGAPVPRRVQYDPRAATAPGTAPRRDMRSGGSMPGRPMGRPGGVGMRRGPGGAPMQRRPAAAVSTQEMSAHKKVIKIEEKISLQTLASRMSLKATEVLLKLLSLGMTGVNINSTLDADTAKLLASEFGWDVEDVAVTEEEAIQEARKTDDPNDETRESRPPIVTVMGHVDHGKTSLLDKIRAADVAAGEAGGITQHIGAYRVQTPKGMITFLDTPGHEAFTQMRARGAQVTDIVILVVAADDGVMPQTKEAAAHAKSANVPIIVAVNKVDKPGAEPERVKRELVELGLQPEEWGGETIFCEVSAKTGAGVDHLLEMISLQAEILELKASPQLAATGTVIEALLDRGKGAVARVLVTDGTLHVGDIMIAGPAWGKVRAMTDEHGQNVTEAGPSTPVELLGLADVPNAGDPLHIVKDAKRAQEIAETRKSKVRNLVPASAKVSLEDLAKRMAEADQLELRLVIKADVQGSVEAVADALAKLSTEKVRVAIIHAGVGAITEGDVNLAVASKAIVIGFGVRPAGKAAGLAESEGVQIRLYNIIYNAVDDVRKAMAGLLAPTLVEKALGKAEVRQVFKVGKVGAIAGCMVTGGSIKRSGKARLMREGVQIWEGKVGGLRRFKDDVSTVAEGMECGIMLDGYADLKEADIIECYEIEEVAATL
jgi:translation initiation factor IF-2